MSEAFDRLVNIMDRLRAPDGCPWDQEQTLSSLSGYLLEEAYETVDAVNGGDPQQLCEELGDLLLQIIFMAKIGSESSSFNADDVCDGISEKMIRRHPHVFAETTVEDSRDVVQRWEKIKQQEKGDKRRSALDGVPASMPGLLKAYRMTQKAAACGFDWQRPADVMSKLREEVDEIEAEIRSDDHDRIDRIRQEMGDILFVMANLARHLGVEPETALQGTNSKFRRRFSDMEKTAETSGSQLSEMSLEELDRLWDQAKTRE